MYFSIYYPTFSFKKNIEYISLVLFLQEELVKEMEKAIKEFFGEKPADSADYGRIINERHVAWVISLVL